MLGLILHEDLGQITDSIVTGRPSEPLAMSRQVFSAVRSSGAHASFSPSARRRWAFFFRMTGSYVSRKNADSRMSSNEENANMTQLQHSVS